MRTAKMRMTKMMWMNGQACLRTLARSAAVLVVLTLAALVSGPSCSQRGAQERCLAEEAKGHFTQNNPQACGCDATACLYGQTCFQNSCCTPELEGRFEASCGCRQVCQGEEVCLNEECIDPFTESSMDKCGGEGPCDASYQKCVADEAGRYHCACDEDKARSNDHCGCDPDVNVCNPISEHCVTVEPEGKAVYRECQCNPLTSFAQVDDSDCGCRGPCPMLREEDGTPILDSDGKPTYTASCQSGVCKCNNPNFVACNGECMPLEACECEGHNDDPYNCGCDGEVCTALKECVAGSCVCSKTANATNPFNCGCSNVECDTANGMTCVDGVCQCPTVYATSMVNCGCGGENCDPIMGEQCVAGTCTCFPSTEVCDGVDNDCDDAVDEGDACHPCVELPDLLVLLNWVGGNVDFSGNGPGVEVDVQLLRTPTTITVQVCVDMKETQSDGTHGFGCESYTVGIQQVGFATVNNVESLQWTYVDVDHNVDDLQFEPSLTKTPDIENVYSGTDLVGGVVCIGDSAGDDLSLQGGPAQCAIALGCIDVEIM